MAKPATARPQVPGDDSPAMNAGALCCNGDELLNGKIFYSLAEAQILIEK
jgi:hypothetical protein